MYKRFDGDGPNGHVSATVRVGGHDGEHPEVVVDDIASRPKPYGKIIAFANEKGGVGKSTLAFQTAIALAHRGQRVAVVDLDRSQQSVSRALANREGSATNLRARLPLPRHTVLGRPCAAQLMQEIQRIGRDADFVILDTAGADSPILRRVVALADKIVTPVNSSFIDLDMIGQIDPVTGSVRTPGHFAGLVGAIREERRRQGLSDCDWIVMKNRLRPQERDQQARVDAALGRLSREFDFRIATPIRERVIFRELFLFGLVPADLKLIPGAPQGKSAGLKELDRLIDEIGVKLSEPCRLRPSLRRAPVIERVGEAYRQSLFAHL